MKFISKKRLGRFILIVSIATLFHNSAIISFIMYPLARKKFDFRIILLCFIFAIILGVAGINELIFKNFGHIVNNINRPDMNYEQIKSIRIEYILEASIFLVYIYSAYRNVKINEKDIVILNTAIMFCFVLVLFCRSSDGGRLSWFFLLGLIAFLTNQFGSGKNLTLKGLSLIAISSILFIRILIAWNGMIIPYKTFFSNGIREGDVIHAQFEYDRRYNDNKLYK